MRQLRDPSPGPIEGLTTVGLEMATNQTESNNERKGKRFNGYGRGRHRLSLEKCAYYEILQGWNLACIIRWTSECGAWNSQKRRDFLPRLDGDDCRWAGMAVDE